MCRPALLPAGALERAQIGPRSYVWAEKEIIEAARYELEETEKFLATGIEVVSFPYVWTTYDVLILPPSFPYGGMENPNCTGFETP